LENVIDDARATRCREEFANVQPVNGARYCIGAVGSGCSDDDGIFHRALFFQNLPNCATVERFGDCDVNAIQLLAFGSAFAVERFWFKWCRVACGLAGLSSPMISSAGRSDWMSASPTSAVAIGSLTDFADDAGRFTSTRDALVL